MKTTAVLLSLVVLACTTPGSRATAQSPTSKKIEELAQQALAEGELPGLGILIRDKGETIYFNVHGKRAIQHDTKAEINDKWHLGSDAKAMTAYLVALAVEEGKLKYEDSLQKLFKGAKFHQQNAKLTLADALIHDSFLHDVTDIQGGKLWRESLTSTKPLRQQRLEMVRASFSEPPYPDNKDENCKRPYCYANINYLLAGVALETIYQKDWETLLREKLFAPLKMNSCGFGIAGVPNETTPSQPWPHVIDEGKLVGAPPQYKLDNPPVLGPAGTVHCSLEDWNKFIAELERKYSKYPAYFAKSRNTYTLGGWGRIENKLPVPIFGHTGSNTFNYAIANFAPERGLVMLLTTNSATPAAETAMRKLNRGIFDLLNSRK